MKTTTKKEIEKQFNLLLRGRQPKPLFSSRHKLALFFSAKSGCTFAVKWYLFQVNMLDAALFYDPWVHNFRADVFYKSFEYKRNLHKILAPNCNIFKFVRNPYSRAVSSYIHAIKYGYENEQVSNFINREVNNFQGFSFNEFILYLESINLRQCDMHHCLQIHPLEENNLVKINFLIKIENSSQDLPIIENNLGLKESKLSEFSKSFHHTKRSEDTTFSGNKIFSKFILEKRVLLPPTKCFYDAAIKARVKHLYALDFEAYDYSTLVLPN